MATSPTASRAAALVLALGCLTAMGGGAPASAAPIGVKWDVAVNLTGSDPVHGHFSLVTSVFSTCRQTVPDSGTFAALETGGFGAASPSTDPFQPKGGFGATVASGFHGPGSYTTINSGLQWDVVPPRRAYDQYSGPGGRLVVRPDGSGALILSHATGSVRGHESGQISWVCTLG